MYLKCFLSAGNPLCIGAVVLDLEINGNGNKEQGKNGNSKSRRDLDFTMKSNVEITII